MDDRLRESELACRGLRPRSSAIQSRQGPAHAPSKAMRLPSGDQAGFAAFSNNRVSRRVAISSAQTSAPGYWPKTSPGSSFLAGSRERMKRIVFPSGDQSG